jgi:hypothetical protein
VIWKFDHMESVDWLEYHYWMEHPLPFGWAIISAPREAASPRLIMHKQ